MLDIKVINYQKGIRIPIICAAPIRLPVKSGRVGPLPFTAEC